MAVLYTSFKAAAMPFNICFSVTISLVFLLGCRQTDPKPIPFQQIGNSVLFASDIEEALKDSPPGDSATKVALFLEDWRFTASLYEQAVESGEENDPETKALLEKTRRKIIADSFVEKKISSATLNGIFLVDSSEVKQYYESLNSTLLFSEPKYKLTRLYASVADTALRFRQLLASGLSLDSLFQFAFLHSPETAQLNQSSYEQATELKSLSQIHLESENLRAILDRMKPKDTSPVIKIAESFFVVMRLEEIALKGQQKSYAQAFPEILLRLKMIKQKRFVDSLANRLIH